MILSDADHPRSRGVYPDLSNVSVGLWGSSPLARGLRLLLDGNPLPTGIIPARAGFTRSTLGCPDRPRDHPRSRGVYRPALSSATVGSGSSPLARGLHPTADPKTEASGIIPARAGFTSGNRGRLWSAWDHPRSRGVYEGTIWSDPSLAGSSPLARGLQRTLKEKPNGERIIPARAGFTAWGRERGRAMGDHPRSRGVYRPLLALTTRARGSSPLARGLLGGADSQGERIRIIPARAGFTRS